MSEWGSRTWRASVAFAAALLLAGTAIAQDAPPAPAAPAEAEGATVASGSCTFDVRDQPLDRVLKYVRDASGQNVVVAPEAMNERVTLAVRGMGWRATLDEVARRVGCTVEDMGEYLRVEKPPRVSFSFEQAEISKVIRTIAALAGANIVADPDDVKGLVTVNLIDQPWKRALTAIVGTKGYQVVEETGGILRVVSANKLKAELETRVYQLRYLRPPPDYTPKLASSPYVERTGARVTGDIEKTFNIITSLREALKPEGTLEYINASNSLVLKGTKPKLAQVEKMLASLDREPLQIFVDMQFVSTRNNDLFQYGLGPTDQGIVGSMSFSKLENAVRLPFNMDNGGWEDWFLVNDMLPDGSVTAPVFTGGSLDFSGTSFLLKLLKNDTKSRVVQAPKLFVLDNQEATIFVGESIRYAQSEASSSQSGTLQFAVREADNSPVSTGFQLLVVPHVIPESDKVMITLVPSQTNLTGTSAELPGFDKFTVGGGLADQVLFLPRESTSTMVTTLICQHGVTNVLGGLITDGTTETTNKVPWLGDIPFFGFLFKSESKGRDTRQLLIFLTPWLIREASMQRHALSADLLAREQGLDEEWRRLTENPAEKLAPAKEPEKKPEPKPEEKKPAAKPPAPPPPPPPAPKPEAPKPPPPPPPPPPAPKTETAPPPPPPPPAPKPEAPKPPPPPPPPPPAPKTESAPPPPPPPPPPAPAPAPVPKPADVKPTPPPPPPPPPAPKPVERPKAN